MYAHVMTTITPLKRVRQADGRKLSQSDVARAMGIDPTFYLRLEQGDRAASAELAQAIAEFFCVEVSEIFTPARYTSELQAEAAEA